MIGIINAHVKLPHSAKCLILMSLRGGDGMTVNITVSVVVKSAACIFNVFMGAAACILNDRVRIILPV